MSVTGCKLDEGQRAAAGRGKGKIVGGINDDGVPTGFEMSATGLAGVPSLVAEPGIDVTGDADGGL